MLDSLDVRNLRLECAVHFGSVKMATRSSTVEPQDKGVTTKQNGSKIYRVRHLIVTPGNSVTKAGDTSVLLRMRD